MSITTVSYLTVLVLALTWSCSHQQLIRPGVSNCNYQLDVVFAIDSSNSMYQENFDREKAALVSLVNNLNVSPLDIQVGVVLFSNFALSHALSGNKWDIVKNITALPYLDENTRTDLAIQVGHQILDNGRGGNVRKLLIIITDGQSSDVTKTLRQAEAAKQAGITIYAVGVTREINEEELKRVASTPQSVFYSENFQTLRQVLMSATNEACVTVVEPTVAPKAFRPDCNNQLDLIIALDGSNSMYETNFNIEKAAIDNFISSLPVSDKGIHVGLVLFSGEVEYHALTGDLWEILNNLKNFRHPDQSTRTDLAILTASRLFLDSRGGDVRKVLVIVTDGRATFSDLTLQAAQQAKSSGISIFALGVTDAIDERQLKALASTPQQAYFSDNYNSIRPKLIQLANVVCDPVTYPTQSTSCNFQLDLIIAIDGSNSMFQEHFDTQKAAIASLVNNLNVGYADIQVGLILFSGEVTSFPLSGDKRQIINAIRGLEYPDDQTRTNYALDEAQLLFSRARGGSVPKLLIIVTDGRSTDRQLTRQSAQAAKNSGISITCVGVTDAIDQQELYDLASSRQQVFFSENFDSLARDVQKAANKACQYVTTPLPSISYRTICNDQLDMVLAFDGSNSIMNEHFTQEKKSVINLVDHLNVSPLDIHVGLVLFSGNVTSRPLSGDKLQIKRDIEAFEYPDDSTRTDLAIMEANKILVQTGRGNIQKLLILITDGRASKYEEALRAADVAKANGVTIYAVGVTDAIDEQELRILASTPNNVFFSQSWQNLQQDLLSATKRACRTVVE